jgi:hypothetical protein
MRIDQIDRVREHVEKRTDGLRIMLMCRHSYNPEDWCASDAEAREYWRDRIRNSIAILRALRRGLAGSP